MSRTNAKPIQILDERLTLQKTSVAVDEINIKIDAIINYLSQKLNNGNINFSDLPQYVNSYLTNHGMADQEEQHLTHHLDQRN